MTWLLSKLMTNPATLLWLLLAAFTAGVTSGAGAAWYVQATRLNSLKAEHTLYMAEVEKNAAEARRLALDKERFWLKERSDAEAAAQKRTEQAKVALAAADRSVDELRDTVSTLRGYLADASREAAITAATTYGELLGACAARYRVLGAAAQGHVIDVEKLMAACPR